MTEKRRNIDIDELFRSELRNSTVEPSPYLKGAVMKGVAVREFLRFNLSSFNVWYLAALVITAAIVLSIILNSGDDATIIMHQQPEDTGHITVETPDVRNITDAENHKTEVLPERDAEGVIISSDRDNAEPPVPADSDKEPHQLRAVASTGTVVVADTAVKTIPPEITLPDTVDTDKSVSRPVSSFYISQLSGCAPLSVQLSNRSEHYSSLAWLISDGRTYDSADADVEFTEPGTYTVILMASDEKGRDDYAIAEIEVYPNPSADFEIVPVNRQLTDREIFLYNHSDEKLSMTWDFGDGTGSILYEPVHHYKEPGKYRIELIVTNDYQCSDTAYLQYSAAESGFRIEFPNAFIPNSNGPTGGYYSATTDAASHVFHPVYEGVADYHLVIYSRTGLVLFESKDLNIGWDGYYKGELSEPGVYIWRAKGHFNNGKEFMKAGDVTLLRF